jgi:DNA-binding MarR family transcriptional regulator
MGLNGRGRAAQDLSTMVRVARVFVGITAESIAQADSGLTLPQLRVLVLASQVEPLSASDVAGALDIHLSVASRMCDRLVRSGLLDRRDRPNDRRQLALTLTAEGRRQLDVINAHRRRVFARLLRRMEPARRSVVTELFGDFLAAAREYDGPRTLIP